MLMPIIAPVLFLASCSGAAGDLKKEGAFGFPQHAAMVLCDTPEVRVSAYSDGQHLFVQAILWNDGDDALGETRDGREIGDRASLIIDVDADGKETANTDRTYHLNPWPSRPGLNYQVQMGDGASTGLNGSSRGRGAVSYVEAGDGKVRVDTFLIPAAELQLKEGDEVRIAYHGNSTSPELIVNSVGHESQKPYYPFHLPHEKFHAVRLAKGAAAIDPSKVPEGRDTIELKPKVQAPLMGEAPPAFGAESWLNWSAREAPTLESLRGKVVVLEFWATWCAPCVAGIPHLNELHGKHAKDGLVLLSLTDQSRKHVEEFVNERQMRYTVGVGSNTAEAYGVNGIPHAFVIGRDGKLLWNGHPAQKEFDEAIERALKQTF